MKMGIVNNTKIEVAWTASSSKIKYVSNLLLHRHDLCLIFIAGKVPIPIPIPVAARIEENELQSFPIISGISNTTLQ